MPTLLVIESSPRGLRHCDQLLAIDYKGYQHRECNSCCGRKCEVLDMGQTTRDEFLKTFASEVARAAFKI